jgi:PilX N-terminal
VGTRPERARPGPERGSALIGALVLLFVLTILGLALFDSALIDAQLALVSVDEHRALASAEAGLERAMHRLYRDLCGLPDWSPAITDTCESPPATARWADDLMDGTPFTVTTGAFATFIPEVQSFAGSFPDPRGPGFPAEEYAGTYAVDLKHLTVDQARALGLACLRDVPQPVCEDLIYVRSTGTAGRKSGGPMVTRVVQALVQGRTPGAAAGSTVVAAETIAGSAEIYGSLHVVPCGGATCSPVTLGAGAGIRNSYTSAFTLQDIVPKLPVVTCPPGTACTGLEVETLQATVKVGKPSTDFSVAVDIQSPGASVGEAGTGSTNPATGNRGKPTMDAVYLGRGCAASGVTPPCADVVANPGKVYADGPIRAYDLEPPPKLPELDDPVRILPAVSRDDYAACSGPGTCNASTGAAVSGSGNDFFISHALRIRPTTMEDDRPYADCGSNGLVRGEGSSPCTRRNLYDMLTTTGGWTQDTATFRYTLLCGGANSPLLGCAVGGLSVTGSVQGSTAPAHARNPVRYLVEWRGKDWLQYATPGVPNTLRFYACDGAACDLITPSNPDLDVVWPLLIYVDGPLRICQGCLGQTFLYQGHAIFLVRGNTADITGNQPSIAIDADLRALCDPCDPAEIHKTFPKRSSLTFYTPGNIFLGMTGPRDFMGRFYAANKLTTTQQINVVGEATARVFDLGTQVPRFWEVPMALAPSGLPTRAPQAQPPRGPARWRVGLLRWKECPIAVTNQPC